MSQPTKQSGLHIYRSPGSAVARFVARRTILSSSILALVFGSIVASKALGFASAYPTQLQRTEFAHTFSNNVGLNIMLGVPHGIESVAGFAAWNTLGIIAIIGSIWGLLLATKNFRGEEDSGRMELFLAGQTTPRRNTLNILLGISSSLGVFYLIMAGVLISVGLQKTVDYSVQSALYYALTCLAGAAVFISIGALASQIMPTRAMAARMSAGIFGLSFLLRAIADTTNLHWLLNFTPLGWIEKTRPLYHSQPIWLLPIGVMIAFASVAAINISGRRDLGASVIKDRDTAEPKYKLLSNSFLANVRLTRETNAGWIVAATIFATMFGLLAKSAAEAFQQSAGTSKTIGRLAHTSHINGAETFLGIAFFMLMNILMLYAASSVGAMREDESQGYLDNFLVRCVNRVRWLSDRIAIVFLALAVAVATTSFGNWLTETSQHAGVPYHTILSASVNVMAPVIFILGISVFALGFVPRYTTLVGYSLVGWSFMIQLLSSGVNLNHWLLDTAILHHVALSPATAPNWHVNSTLLGLGAGLAILGIVRFNYRDLQTE